MQNVSNKIAATAIKLARLAAGAATDAERDSASAKLAAHCTQYNLNAADVIARAAQPDTVKPAPLTDTQRAARDAAKAPKPAKPAEAAKPKAETVKPKADKPTKPSEADAKRASDYAERVKLIGELRAAVNAIYNGPSLAVRSNPKRIAASAYADLLANPKHRTDVARVSLRDESALALIVQRGDAAGCFDPVALNFDAGIFSRLASVAFIEAAPASAKLPYRLTKAGADHARSVTKRAA